MAEPAAARPTSSSPTSPRSSGSTRASPSTPAGSAFSPATISRRRRSSASRSSGIGLFYRRGYFEQRLDENDRQIEHYPLTDTSRLPLELVPMAPVVELADDSGELVPVRLGVWRVRVGRASLYLIDTQVERKPGLGRHRHPLRRRPGEPAAAGDPARCRRRPRAARARARADGLPPERGPLRVPPARAHARARGGAGPVGGRGARAAARLHGLHDAHAGAGGERGVRSRSSCDAALGGLVERCGLGWEEFARARQGRAGRERIRAYAVRAPHVAVRERGLGAPRRRVARDVARTLARAARRPGPDHLGHERCPPAHLDLRRAGGSARRHRPAVRARARPVGRGPLGCASQRKGAAAPVRRRDPRRARARPGDPHDRLRTPLRDLQAREPPLQPARSASRDSSPTPSGRSRCSWPARRTRPTRRGRT